MNRVLLIEDERAIAESLEFALRRDGFAVDHSKTVSAARALCLGTHYELIVLDLMLPDGSGFDLLRELREAGLRTPVIILSSRDEEADRVAGLEGGADDYVTKPFSPREVVARVRAVLRRTRPAPAQLTGATALLGQALGQTLAQPPHLAPPPTAAGPGAPPQQQDQKPAAPAQVQVGPLSLDDKTRRAAWRGTLLDLTRTEFDLLRVLLTDPERVFTRQELKGSIFGAGYVVTDRTIDAHIKALRKKLAAAGASPDLIETERGVGYRLRDANSS
jgi:two-component system catabolic regulation response regulator CreB